MSVIGTRSRDVIAHRCRGFDAPEQTPQAIAAALASGAAIHLAARLTKDGRWVLPKADDAATTRAVHTRSAVRSRRFALPLEHALALVATNDPRPDATRPLLYLEVKDLGEMRTLCAAIARADLLGRTVLVAWDPQVLRLAHQHAPSLRLAIAFVPLAHALRNSRSVTHGHKPRKRVSLTYDPAQRIDAIPGIGATPVHELDDPALAGIPLAAVFVPALVSRTATIRLTHARDARLIVWGVQGRLVRRVSSERGADAILTDHALALLTTR